VATLKKFINLKGLAAYIQYYFEYKTYVLHFSH
jgi:hypothetical protein